MVSAHKKKRKLSTSQTDETSPKVAKVDEGVKEKKEKKQKELKVSIEKKPDKPVTVKTVKNSEGGVSEGEKNKKRPWRNKVRKLAAKKAKSEAQEANKSELPPPIPVADAEGVKKKKKRGPKKKKFKSENGDSEKKKKTENKEEPEAEQNETHDAIEEAKKKLEAGRFRFLNEKLYTCTGSDALEYFKEDPKAFEVYHKGFADQVKKWPNHPLHDIIRWLQGKPDNTTVFDMGCGEAKIAEAVGKKLNVKSFDLVAVNDRVTSCDMANLPATDEEADVVVFCLSLMGTNLYDFIKEARRVLKMGGVLKIAEVTSRFVNVKMFCEAVNKMGFEMTAKRQLTDYFIMFDFKKIGKVQQKRPYGLKLKPCVYKKR